MKNPLFLLMLTVLCMILMFMPHSFAQNFVDGQMPDAFLNVGSSVRDINFSPDGTTLASAGGDNTIKLWDVATGTLKDTLEGHTESPILNVAFSPDGTTLAGGSAFYIMQGIVVDRGTIKLWDVASDRFKAVLVEHTAGVNSVAFSPDGTLLASGSDDNTIKLWDVATATLKDTLEEHTGDVSSIAFSPDGTMLASGSDDNTIKLWDVATATLKDTLIPPKSQFFYNFDVHEVGSSYSVNTVAFSPDGTTLASGSRESVNSSALVYRNSEAITAFASQITPLVSYINTHGGMSFSTYWIDDYQFFTVDKGTIYLWDIASGTLKASLEGHINGVNDIAFSPDGRTLASGRSDKTVKLWDVTRQTKGPKATLSAHGGSVYSVAFSPDGNQLASGSQDGAVRLWTALPPANGDGVVNIADLIEVAQNFGQVGENDADINGDGVVNIIDLILVAVALGEVAGAPAAHAEAFSMFTVEEVEQWLIEAKQLQTADPNYLRGILFLEQLLAILTPKETALLANYPNPFNPETWIPYQLAKPADVKLTIYDINGHVVRALDLGHQHAGIYQSRSRGVHWDGRNAQGEPVASGVYFYTLTADDFTATRKMLIRK